ncbi:MAG TPA: HAMP domain-containing sensor histidine kinase [Thermoanaerobaculia bacterium]
MRMNQLNGGSTSPWMTAIRGYGLAALFVIAAGAISWLINPWIEPQAKSPYFAAVLLSAVIGGTGPGLFATVFASVAIAWFELGSERGFNLGADDLFRLAVFTATALVISSVSSARKTAERELRVALERLAAVDRAKDEFIATLSHELRTPLTAIVGWLRILREPGLDEATRTTAISSLEQSARMQQMLIDDLLDHSRIILGKLEIRHEPLVLREVVEQAIDIIRPEAEAKQVRVIADTGTGAAVIDGDPGRLKQVCWNLLTNAVKFTPAGGTVRVAVKTNQMAEIEVEDDGEGIDPDLLPHIFERFSQGTSGHKGGLGLGLTIVRHIIELHGGDVSATSRGRGRGARFVVRVPLAKSQK